MSEAIRDAYGKILQELGKRRKDLVVLDADVSSSTRSAAFAAKYPDRFLNMGIAEANMVGWAAGIAVQDMIPIVNTFSFLLSERCLDQIRSSVAYNNLNVKFAANYGGLSDSYDGASHHALSDLSIMRSIPNMTIVNISDAEQMKTALEPICDYQGPVYFRLCRNETPVLHKKDDEFAIGRGYTWQEGEACTLIATGVVLGRTLEAADQLRKLGIDAGVIEIHTIKPLDEQLLLEAARKTGILITIEEGNIMGGLGAAVAQLAARERIAAVIPVGIADCFAESGPYEDLLDKYGLAVATIVEKARSAVTKKETRP